MGRDFECNIPRGIAPAHRLIAEGVNCSISTNNLLNPFTPYGDGSLIRMANLYANAAQLGDPGSLALCLDMITGRSAQLLNFGDYGLSVGNPADIVIFDAETPAQLIAEIGQPLMGFKSGRRSFTRAPVRLHDPGFER